MTSIYRKAGKTIIELNGKKIITDRINRHAYNTLRKKAVLNASDVIWALNKSK